MRCEVKSARPPPFFLGGGARFSVFGVYFEILGLELKCKVGIRPKSRQASCLSCSDSTAHMDGVERLETFRCRACWVGQGETWWVGFYLPSRQAGLGNEIGTRGIGVSLGWHQAHGREGDGMNWWRERLDEVREGDMEMERGVGWLDGWDEAVLVLVVHAEFQYRV